MDVHNPFPALKVVQSLPSDLEFTEKIKWNDALNFKEKKNCQHSKKS